MKNVLLFPPCQPKAAMKNAITILFLGVLMICFACKHEEKKTEGVNKDSSSHVDSASHYAKSLLSAKNDDFGRKIYLEISEVTCGRVYTNSKGIEVFNRVLAIPVEEEMMLVSENISIGEEGGNYNLLKRVLLDTVPTLRESGIARIDSLKFIDSVTLSGYFNSKKLKINVETNKVVN